MVDLFNLETSEQKRETFFICFIGHNRTGKPISRNIKKEETKKQEPKTNTKGIASIINS